MAQKCSKCNKEFSDGDIVAVRLNLVGNRRKKSQKFKPAKPVSLYHHIPNDIRIQRQNSGELLPIDCCSLNNGYFSKGIYYQNRIYHQKTIVDLAENTKLSIGLNEHRNGLSINGDLTRLLSVKPDYDFS